MSTRDHALHGNSVIELLRDPASYPHAVGPIARIETHISDVFLTGDIVYKVKKPLDLGFLDFSTLEKRKHFCEEEVRLNRRFAPGIYLDVVGITASGVVPPGEDGAEDVIEYAVRMRQFDGAHQFDVLLSRDALTMDAVIQLAVTIARFHERASVCPPDGPHARLDVIREQMVENLGQCEVLLPADPAAGQVAELRWWVDDFLTTNADVFEQRRRDGFIRECHGDLHLANITMIDDLPVPFDCIEFDPAYRWIDVISEVAFMLMDLDFRHRADLSWRFLNSWLEQTGDYAGVKLLSFYQLYRATVRAKVAAIRASNDIENVEKRDDRAEAVDYLSLATGYTEKHPVRQIIITHGLSGCGKTFVASELLSALEAVRIRSDVERKRLHGMSPNEHAGGDIKNGIYNREADDRTYSRLADLARGVVEAGYSVILDATFLFRSRRECVYELGARLNVPVTILDISAPEAVLRQRITERALANSDASDANLAVLDYQIENEEPLGNDELVHTVKLDTTGILDVDALATRLR